MINSVDNKVISVKISISKNRFQLKAKQYLHKWIFEKENRQERPRQFFVTKSPVSGKVREPSLFPGTIPPRSLAVAPIEVNH